MYQDRATKQADCQWYLYLIQTAKGLLYTGITTDVARRLAEHNSGRGAKALRGRGPLTVVFQSPVGDRASALRIEYQIKQLSRLKKLDIVSKQPPNINDWLIQLIQR
ncbi:GIY-YIG nuclease family protein [Rosenbergiella sp. S61]|uniref:GIY-YIG nuclease family protein n=1 Tax=Rosenbergiella gaditana TaxID=2726987 RepID=A0ABS5T0N0_9GAMM|nr:GIY-YIG nuclease family protein [Rosenbergiella gaditana]MBT0725727.1 GIY-YIG nuclease family protein [Rosenbergiella gaditana]